MTLGIDVAQNFATRSQTLNEKAAALSPTIVPIALGTVLALAADAVNRQQSDAARSEGRTGPAPVLDMPPSRLSQEEAALLLLGTVARMHQMLSGTVGSSDPLKNEEGASQRLAENVASQQPTATRTDGPSAPLTAAAATGMDADLVSNRDTLIGWFKSNFGLNLLIQLRDVLRKFEALDAKSSADANIMRLEVTEFAAEKQVQAAVERFTTSIASAGLGVGISAASLKKTYEATSIQTSSLKDNVGGAHVAKTTIDGGRSGTKALDVPSREIRPASNLDGSPVRSGRDRAGADIQGDNEANLATMNNMVKPHATAQGITTKENRHVERMTESTKVMSQAQLIGQLVATFTSSVTAGGNIQAESTAVVGQIAQQEASITADRAKHHQDQMANNRALRDATAQLCATLLAQQTSTNDHIVQRI